MPILLPVITPVAAVMDALEELLVHVPPGVALESVVVCPVHMDVPPVMADGGVLIVNVVVTLAVQYPPKPADTGSLVALSVYVYVPAPRPIKAGGVVSVDE